MPRRHNVAIEDLEARLALAGPQELLQLVDADTHSIGSGSWDDPFIWSAGVPNETDDVYIQSDHAITITADASADVLRIDGQLWWHDNVDATLDVDTILVALGGMYVDKTATNAHRVIFRDDGPIDTAWDNTMVSRGLVSQGTVVIEGAPKTSHVKALSAMAGDGEIWLDDTVSGWQIGDTVLVAGTHKTKWGNSQDELRTITDISFGRLVTLDQPLTFDHDTPVLDTLDGLAPFKPDIANLSRNISFTSTNTETPSRAGHVMFMTPSTSIEYASFDHIGRNDKTQPTTDPDGNGNGLENPRGRYGLHFHKMGPTNESLVIGSVITNSPGWGFVNHDSYVTFRDNVGYRNLGAHFVTEVGSEVGRFENNLAVYNQIEDHQTRYQLSSGTDQGLGRGFGSMGHGFWMHSTLVDMVDNTAAGMVQEAFIIHGLKEPSDPVPKGFPVLGTVSNIEAYASGTGISIQWHRPLRELEPDGDVIRGLQLWNIGHSGIRVRYTTGVTFAEGIVHGEQQGTPEVFELSQQEQGIYRGFVSNFNSGYLGVSDLAIEGFDVGIQATTNGDTTISDVAIDAAIAHVAIPPAQGNVEIRGTPSGQVGEHPQRVLINNLEANGSGWIVHFDERLANEPFAGHATPADKMANYTMDSLYMLDSQQLWRYDQAADSVPFDSATVPTWMATTYPEQLDKTMSQLSAEDLLLFAGSISPSGATDQAAMGINGLGE